MLTIYHNPSCSKSRETLKIIEEQGAQVEIVKYLNEIPTIEELTEIVQKLKIKPEELVRKGETIFKEQFKGKVLSDSQWIEAMATYPKLIERPIVVKGNQAIIGRPPQKVIDLL